MNISAISDQEYQNIIDGFKRIQESSPNLELNPEISPRKLSRNIRNKKSKKFFSNLLTIRSFKVDAF